MNYPDDGKCLIKSLAKGDVNGTAFQGFIEFLEQEKCRLKQKQMDSMFMDQSFIQSILLLLRLNRLHKNVHTVDLCHNLCYSLIQHFKAML